MRPCSIRARKSGLRRGVSWPHHAKPISPCEIKMTVVDHARFACGRDHLAQKHDAFSALGKYLGDLLDCIRLHDGDQADAAVEGAQQFEFGDAPLLCQPFEDRQHGNTRKVDPDGEMLWQHARNIVGEAAAGDVGKDRKSTRLNSSHITISYAVFCLKKKKSDVFCDTTP